MNIWLLLNLFLPSCYYATRDAQYECGPHGRFEYCIDGIPGCVIGCHCHPGYYFDTDSKICESNIKLGQDYRRHYLSEPTRIQVPSFMPPIRNGLTSTTNPVDDKIDEITKDAGDLGDWLYNQFFKTIENQVINNTNENEQILTRRTGSAPMKKKPKRKNRKYWRKSDKKRKNKKSGLKKKLLRITEDDSLFDSSSSSSSDETSSSSSNSDSGTSSESYKHKDHGHKKIVIYNKKPKQPLPSFIFLPNMDTPFYPPIGLPPPSALPMYPMVPVPPMGPMFPYIPGTTENCNDQNDKSTTNGDTTINGKSSLSTSPSQSSDASTRTIESKTETTTTAASETTTSTTPDKVTTRAQDAPGAEGNVARFKHNKQPGARSKNEKRLKGRLNLGPQTKLLQKIKEYLKKRNKIGSINHFTNKYPEEDESFLESNDPQNPLMFFKKQTDNFEDDTPMEDVDFKYITELIHRANNTKHGPKLPSNDIFVGIPGPPPTRRRNYYHNSDNIPPSNFVVKNIGNHRLLPMPQESDDSYYTNLGREIASMIRKIDFSDKRQLNIEIERSNPSTTTQPFFNEHIYASRSYWDRFIRSLETKYNPSYSRDTKCVINSDENLMNIENKVERAVSTILPLSLHELENIINGIKYKHNQTLNKNIELAQEASDAQFEYKLLRKPKITQKINDTTIRMVNISQAPESTVNNNKVHVKQHNKLLKHFRNMVPLSDNTINEIEIRKTLVISPTRRSFNDGALKIPLLGHLQFLKNTHNVSLNRTTNKTNYMPYQVNSVRLNNNYLNYYSGNNNNNQYLYQKSTYPFYFLDKKRQLYRSLDQSIKPSYFHHELHHFDYFDK